MSYAELEQLIQKSGKTIPLTAINENGENVVICGNSDVIVTETYQRNDWVRVNEYYKDGTVTETFER